MSIADYPRKTFLLSRRQTLAAMAAAPFAAHPALAQTDAATAPADWASGAAWTALRDWLGDRLFPVQMPDLSGAAGAKLLANPIAFGDEPALTQSSGWIDGWRSAPSLYAVRARDAADVSHAVRFARDAGARIVIRGGGHSYHGTSCAAGSLLLWTRGLDGVRLHDAFVPSGGDAPGAPAVSLGAGCVWAAAYDTVTRQAGRYVQGGGCTTVGVAGLIQGGGFGNFSKGYGMAAASLLEAEIVTADGAVRTVNAHRDPDLFWALKGGGGGTFGVVTRVTVRTHDLPETFGAIRFTIRAKDDAAFRRLIDRFLTHYRTALFNPHWGEQVVLTPSRRLIGEMVFQGIGEAEARQAWSAFMAFAATDPDAFEIIDPLAVYSTPARLFWDAENMNRLMPGIMTRDPRPHAGSAAFWWTGDGEQAGRLWHGMESAWLSQSLLEDGARDRLADALHRASRIWAVSLHFNKGLAGGSASARAASADTAVNPDAIDAFCLALIAANGSSCYPGVAPVPDWSEAREEAQAVSAAMQALRTAAPGAGAYLYESSYDMADAANRAWGSHVARLQDVKRRYDPTGLFQVHHGIGSSAG